MPGYKAFLDFMTGEYIPHARETLGASQLPNGEAYYAHLVREHTSLDVTSDSVHRLGLAEVDRIHREMQQVMEQVNFKGDFAAFLQFLRTDPQFYPKTPEELLSRASWIAKRMDGKLPSLFKTLPRLPYGVEPVPAELAPKYTAGRYVPAPVGGTQAGIYWVNTYALNSRTLYTLESLTLHEAVPGHHLQFALAQELKGLPDFRRFVSVDAFSEGWGLYSEHLGLEAGFYTDPYSNFGRLTYNVACVPARRGHRHSLEGVDAAASPGLPRAEHRALAARGADGDRPVHRVAGSGARVQDGRARDSIAASSGRAGARHAIQRARIPRRGAAERRGHPRRTARPGARVHSSGLAPGGDGQQVRSRE